MYDYYMCKFFQFHFLIVDKSFSLIGYCPLIMIAGIYRVNSVREGAIGKIQRRQREEKDKK